MTLPARFVAAWERTELVVDGAVVPDAGRAVWVEAGDAYVDVRGPGGFASETTFAGTTSWTDPYLAWAHAIDAEPGEAGDDRGLMSFDGDDMIEEGEVIAGRLITYSERWRPLPGSKGIVLAARSEHGIAVRVGDHASVVVDDRTRGGAIAARYDRWDGSSWSPQIEFGDAADRARLPAPLAPASDLPPGWSWT